MADIDTTDSLIDNDTPIKAAAADKVVGEDTGKAKFLVGATIRDSATKLTQNATDKVRAYADEGKSKAGDALDEFSRLMGDAATSVDERLGAEYGQYARSAADTIANFSTSMKAKEVDELIDDARGFVKKSPAIAIGTAAVLGFAVARLIKAGIDAGDTGKTST